MEYHYTRMYINSIAVQALVERASHATSGDHWLEQDFLRKECARDLRFINEVRESSGQVLAITKRLSDEGVLQYFPVRFFLRVVAASIFLLKIVCLGLKVDDTRVALDQLEHAVEALMCKGSDDIHLSSRYAELIARHVRRMKRKFHVEHASRESATKANTPKSTAAPSQNEIRDNYVPASAMSGMSQDDGTAQLDFGLGPSGGVNGNWSDTFWDDWIARPLDPLVAPFGVEPAHAPAGLTSDSLDFLWSSHG